MGCGDWHCVWSKGRALGSVCKMKDEDKARSGEMLYLEPLSFPNSTESVSPSLPANQRRL